MPERGEFYVFTKDGVDSSQRNGVIRPRVSIVMNCYNGEKFLCEAINSVLAQTYHDWELVFWDNQSTDKSAEIFNSYADIRLKYFHAPTHTLLYEARNYAFKKTQGEFIAFLDVDDWWECDKLEKQIPLFNDPSVGLVYGNYWKVTQGKELTAQVMYNRPLPEGRVLNLLLGDYVVGLLTIVVRRYALVSLDKLFDSRYQVIGDLDIVIRLAINWRLSCIQSPVASYRSHSNNLSTLDLGRSYTELENWYEEMGLNKSISEQPNFGRQLERLAYPRAVNAIMQGQRSKALVIFSGCPLNLYKVRLLIVICTPLPILRIIKRLLLSVRARCRKN